MKNISWKAWLGALALVVFGAALGAVGTTYIGVRKLRENLNNPGAARVLADRALMRIQKNLTKELDLTPEERKQLEATLAESAANLRTLRQQNMRESRAELVRVVRQIADELPPEKRAAFRRHVAKQMMWLTGGGGARREGQNPPPTAPERDRERPD